MTSPTDDWALVDALVCERIDQAEPGNELRVVELSDEEEASWSQTSGAVGAGSSTSESSRNVARTTNLGR